MFPGRMDAEALKRCPPVCVFTSEFDMLRRDALHIVERLKKCNKYLDCQDMPGVTHMYQMIGDLEQTKWFFEEYAKAFEKYVKCEGKAESPVLLKQEEESDEETEDKPTPEVAPPKKKKKKLPKIQTVSFNMVKEIGYEISISLRRQKMTLQKVKDSLFTEEVKSKGTLNILEMEKLLKE